MKKILSIDGGGIRGLIPALVLAEFEKKTNKPIAELFDLIAGTSTGAVSQGERTRGLIVPGSGQAALFTRRASAV